MTRPPRPARRQALWRAAPLRLWRTPGWFVLMLVSATLLVASLVAPSLFVGAARTTALADGLKAVVGQRYGPESGDLRVTWDTVLPPAAEAVLMDRLDDLTGWQQPTVGAAGVATSHTRKSLALANGESEPSVLWYHDGAIEALGGDEDAKGVWLAADVAEGLGLEVGDEFRIGLTSTFLADAGTATKTTLLGTYETAPDTTLPAALVDAPDVGRWFLPPDPDDPSHGTPLAIAGRGTFDKLIVKTAEKALYLADMPLEPHVTPEEAAAAVVDLKQLGNDAYDPSTDLAAALREGDPVGARVQVASGLPDIVFNADTTADSARDQVRPYGVAGQVLAAALLVAGWVLLGRSRRREQLLASGLGLRPTQVAGMGALEVLPVCLLAVPAGVGLALLGLAVAGPQTEAPLTLESSDWVRGAAAAVLALLLIGVTAGASAAATDRQARSSRLGRRVSIPWGVALLVATIVVGIAVLGVDVGDRSSTPLAMALPVMVAGVVALAVARVAGWLAGRGRGRGRKGTARWLAFRRTGTVVREVTALTVVVAVALGLFGYALTVRRGLDQGVDDKTAALVGARSMIEVAEDFRGQKLKGAITPPAEDTTIVWRRGASLPPKFGDVPVLAIDPVTFADVADWGASGDLDPGRAMVPLLEKKAKGLPVILAGDTEQSVGDHGTLNFSGEFQIPFEVVGVVPAFPGSESDSANVTVVINARKLIKLLPPTVNPRREGASSGDAGAFSSWVWSNQTPTAMLAALDAAGIATDGDQLSADRERLGSGLIAATWAAGYVLALGCVALALAVAAALVLALRLADRDAVSDVLLGRMGYGTGELARSRTWEVAYAVLTAVIAAGLATTVLVLGPTTIDATAAIPPLTRPRPDVADLIILGCVMVGMVLLAWLIGSTRARRRHPAEVLRAGG